MKSWLKVLGFFVFLTGVAVAGVYLYNQQTRTYTPLEVADYIVKCDKQKALRAIKNLEGDINEDISKRRRLIHLAVQYCDLEVVRALVEKGADINIKDEKGRTALHYAAKWSKPEVIKYLVSKGADINEKTVSNATPLMYATSQGSFETVKTIIDLGADINVQDNKGNTALHWAAAGQQPADEKQKIIKLLVDKGADTSAVNTYGQKYDDVLKNFSGQ